MPITPEESQAVSSSGVPTTWGAQSAPIQASPASSYNPFLNLPTTVQNTIPEMFSPGLSTQTSSTYPVPEVAPTIPQDHLMDQITHQNSELLDVLKEIAQLDKIRARLEKHNEQRSIAVAKKVAAEVRQRLSSRFEGGFRAYDDFEVLKYLEEVVLEKYPTVDYSLEHAKEDRNISKDIASMYEKYQRIIKGTTINIEFTSKLYDKLLGYVFECTCTSCQLRLSERLRKDAHSKVERRSIQL